MEKFKIIGPSSLNGMVTISGAKNAALPEIAAAILTEEKLTLENLPHVKDVKTLLKILDEMGFLIDLKDDGCSIKFSGKINPIAPYELVKTMRASFLVLGPLLAKYKRAKVSLPGGCLIGARPVDLHLKGLSKMGAQIKVEHGYVIAEAEKLKGCEYTFEKVTVTGTENLLMAATLADGETILNNCATEPEVEDLANLLKKMGAKIDGVGTRRIVVEGVEELNGAKHSIIPDRIEAGTFLIASIITGGKVLIKNCNPFHMASVIDKLEEMGAKLNVGKDFLEVHKNNVDSLLPSLTITNPYPGFPTDMQAQLMVLCTQIRGTSVIRETIFENRFNHAYELNRMGADIKIEGDSAIINGKSKLSGCEVMASDLRAGASLVIAGLVSEGETIVNRIYHLDRGYDSLEVKLKNLGAKIERIR